jgi:hypothetical protein
MLISIYRLVRGELQRSFAFSQYVITIIIIIMLPIKP